MQKGCPRLWKKIGSQSHHPLEFSSHNSIQSENHRFIQKQDIQQICLPTEESIIRDRENQPSLDQCCKDCITQLALLGVNELLEVNKQQQRKNEKILGVCRCNGKEKEKQQMSLNKDMGKNDGLNKLKRQKLKEVLLGLMSAIGELKNKIRQLQTKIEIQKSKALGQVQLILSGLHRTMNGQVQRIKQARQALRELQKNSETRYKQIQDKMQIRQKQLQNKIAQLDIKLINQRYEEQKLKKQNQIIKAQRDRLFRDNGDLYEKVFDLEQQVLGIDLEVQKRVGEIFKVTVGRYVASDKNQGSAKGVQQFTPSKQEHLDIYGHNLYDTHKITTQKNHLPRLSIKTDDRPSTNSVLKNPSCSLRSLFSPSNRQKKYCSPVKASRIGSPSNSMTFSVSQTQKKSQAQDRSWKQTQSNSIQSSKFIKKESLGSDKRTPNINDISSKIHSIRYQIENEIKNMRSTSKSFNK